MFHEPKMHNLVLINYSKGTQNARDSFEIKKAGIEEVKFHNAIATPKTTRDAAMISIPYYLCNLLELSQNAFNNPIALANYTSQSESVFKFVEGIVKGLARVENIVWPFVSPGNMISPKSLSLSVQTVASDIMAKMVIKDPAALDAMRIYKTFFMLHLGAKELINYDYMDERVYTVNNLWAHRVPKSFEELERRVITYLSIKTVLTSIANTQKGEAILKLRDALIQGTQIVKDNSDMRSALLAKDGLFRTALSNITSVITNSIVELGRQLLTMETIIPDIRDIFSLAVIYKFRATFSKTNSNQGKIIMKNLEALPSSIIDCLKLIGNDVDLFNLAYNLPESVIYDSVLAKLGSDLGYSQSLELSAIRLMDAFTSQDSFVRSVPLDEVLTDIEVNCVKDKNGVVKYTSIEKRIGQHQSSNACIAQAKVESEFCGLKDLESIVRGTYSITSKSVGSINNFRDSTFKAPEMFDDVNFEIANFVRETKLKNMNWLLSDGTDLLCVDVLDLTQRDIVLLGHKFSDFIMVDIRAKYQQLIGKLLFDVKECEVDNDKVDQLYVVLDYSNQNKAISKDCFSSQTFGISKTLTTTNPLLVIAGNIKKAEISHVMVDDMLGRNDIRLSSKQIPVFLDKRLLLKGGLEFDARFKTTLDLAASKEIALDFKYSRIYNLDSVTEPTILAKIHKFQQLITRYTCHHLIIRELIALISLSNLRQFTDNVANPYFKQADEHRMELARRYGVVNLKIATGDFKAFDLFRALLAISEYNSSCLLNYSTSKRIASPTKLKGLELKSGGTLAMLNYSSGDEKKYSNSFMDVCYGSLIDESWFTLIENLTIQNDNMIHQLRVSNWSSLMFMVRSKIEKDSRFSKAIEGAKIFDTKTAKGKNASRLVTAILSRGKQIYMDELNSNILDVIFLDLFGQSIMKRNYFVNLTSHGLRSIHSKLVSKNIHYLLLMLGSTDKLRLMLAEHDFYGWNKDDYSVDRFYGISDSSSTISDTPQLKIFADVIESSMANTIAELVEDKMGRSFNQLRNSELLEATLKANEATLNEDEVNSLESL